LRFNAIPNMDGVSQRFYDVKTDTPQLEGVALKAASNTLKPSSSMRFRGIESRGKRKLSKEALASFPREIVGTFARLPKVFKKVDIDRLMGNKISRSMKWRYVRRMERQGIVKHATKKYYRKVYDTISEWMEKDAIPRIRRMESLVEVETP
jgi:hypothetical protein